MSVSFVTRFRRHLAAVPFAIVLLVPALMVAVYWYRGHAPVIDSTAVMAEPLPFCAQSEQDDPDCTEAEVQGGE